MKKVRLGIIGVGGMGHGHCKSCKAVEEVELRAVGDIDEAVVNRVSAEYGVKGYTDYRQLIDSGDVDAIIVATPHYQHPPISIYAMKKGLDVLSEKPIAVTVKQADEMIKVAEKTKKVFSVMFQYRSVPVYQTAKRLITAGKLGEIYRTLMICGWFRSQAYYNSGTWRATWRGEGGGVLLNQAPHLLDMFTWLAGVPTKVSGVVNTKRHRIEVEDEAYALLEYANGAVGYIYTSVNEAPAQERIEISGEKGKLIVDGSILRYASLKTPIQEYSDTTEEMWGSPGSTWEDVPIPEEPSGHSVIIKNFARSILYGEKLITPGKEGINSVELANAIILSGKKHKEVKIPISHKEYDDLLKKLCQKYTGKKEVKEVKRVTDPSLGT